MLSIKALKPGNERYYLTLALEDYYHQGGEPPGFWLGTGARILGLRGEVTRDQLSKLFQGYSPDSRMAPLVQNAGALDRQSGWDLTFSVPKTVSVLWSAGDENIRREIEAAEKNALIRIVSYVEEHLAHSRVGKGGHDEVPARVVVAAFPHSTSRALDPHCHFHSLFLNVGVGPDAQTRTIQSFPFYQNKMLLGALFRAELAFQLLERLGLALSEERTWFEVDGVPPALAREESTRRREIEAELGRLGLETATAAAYATLKTRRVKEIVPSRDELFEKWKAAAKHHGLDEAAINSLIARQRPPRPEAVLPRATREALKALTKEHSHFSKADFLRALAEAPAALGVSVDALSSHTERVLAWSPDLISLGIRNGEARYTTKRMLELEQTLLTAIHKLNITPSRSLSNATVTAVIAKVRDFTTPPTKSKLRAATNSVARKIRRTPKPATATLSDEQAQAVIHIAQNSQRIALLSGYAGTAKTTTLQAVREAFEAEGYKVIGASLSGKAARELSSRAGIPSTTIRMRELELNPSLTRQLTQHARQLYRAARKWKTSKPERLVIDAKTVLVVDEASMIGTKDMLMLVNAVVKGGGKLVLAGDPHQLPSIDAGGPFGSIAEYIPSAQLRNVVRQSDPGDREAVKALPPGDAHRALANYVEKDQVKLAETRSELFSQLIDDWKKGDGIHRPQENIICAALNREVDELNDLAQAHRLHAGALDPTRKISIRRKGNPYEPTRIETFCIGDRVAVTKKSRKYGLENGDTGTLVGILNHPLSKKISVLFDGQTRPQVFPVRNVPIRRGYAFTTHKLQGGTATNVYVAMTGPMLNRQMAYVQMSRHKQSLTLYVPESLAEKELLKTIEQRSALTSPKKPLQQSDTRSVLTNLMAKEATKDLAHNVIASEVPSSRNNSLTQEKSERLLHRFAVLGELDIARNKRELGERIVAKWQQFGGVTRPEEHRMFAQSEADRQTLNTMAQMKRQELGHLDSTRYFEQGNTRIFVGDSIRFEAEIKKHRISAEATARVVDMKGGTITVLQSKSNEAVTLPSNLVRVTLAYALPSKDMAVTRPTSAHLLVSDRCTTAELSHVYYSLHRERCRLYMTDATAGESIRTLAADNNFHATKDHSHSEHYQTPGNRTHRRVISHG